MEPENQEDPNDALRVGNRLIAAFGPMLLYWHHFHTRGIRIDTNTKPTDTIARNFLKLLANDGSEVSSIFIFLQNLLSLLL
jgi:hypothetical protein